MSDQGLSVKIYLTSGSVDEFELADANQIGVFTELLNPHKVFSGQPIIFSEEHGISAYRPLSVIRIDLTGALTPNWPYLGNAYKVTEVTEAEFEQAIFSSDLVTQRREAWEKPGTAQEGFTILNLANGSRIIWRIKMRSTQMVALDVAAVSRQFFNANALHGERIDGGLMIVNTSHVESMSFHPGPPQRAGRLLLVRRLGLQSANIADCNETPAQKS